MTQGLVVDTAKACIFLENVLTPVLDATHPNTPGKQRKKYTYAYMDRDIATRKENLTSRRAKNTHTHTHTIYNIERIYKIICVYEYIDRYTDI